MARAQPSSSEVSRRMAKVRQKGTGAEIALRRELYRRGLRYRVEFEVLKKPRRIADIAFPRLMIAIFVDGCFWHGCPEHATWPKQNSEFWRQKIEANRARDADTNERLQSIGWTVLRFWEHEPPIKAAEIVAQRVAMGKSTRCALSASSLKKN
ncbi:very short patch repair endonuclease [Massilia sp. YIM B04103]|uniref:very short patch repair endonuclease n=1 Tax=Massilia sp. YIM B04103 TaxID=2963106 RepID=UPI00210A16EC|nr:very short patch repair endonuclease [Massilia sp. YIM B04103]